MSNNLTTNVNMLSPGNFKVTIDNSAYANLQFFCTAVNLPGVSQAATQVNYRDERGYFADSLIDYQPISITFVVDEDMKNYLEIFDWFIFNKEADEIRYKDITLSILSNKNLQNKQILFHSAFPTDLSELSFTTQDTNVDYVTCTATFNYNKFEFIK